MIPLSRFMLITFIVFSSLLNACTSASSTRPPQPTTSNQIALGSCGLALPEDSSDEEAIWALIAAESRYVVSQEINKLMGLWAQDARITDMGHTPEQAEDDQSWRGADVIRHRYLRIVFPSAPDTAQTSEMDVQIDGERAIVTATTQIGEELSVAGDRWQVVRKDGCWLIESLEFNRELEQEE